MLAKSQIKVYIFQIANMFINFIVDTSKNMKSEMKEKSAKLEFKSIMAQYLNTLGVGR